MSYQIQLIYQNNVRITDNHPHPGINNILKLSLDTRECMEAKRESTILMKDWSDWECLNGSDSLTTADNLLIKRWLIIDSLQYGTFPQTGKMCWTKTLWKCDEFSLLLAGEVRWGEGLMRRYHHTVRWLRLGLGDCVRRAGNTIDF